MYIETMKYFNHNVTTNKLLYGSSIVDIKHATKILILFV